MGLIKSKGQHSLFYLIAGIILLLLIVGNVFFYRFDFTQEKRYTLAPISRQIIKDIKADIYITVYLEGEFPSGFKHLQSEIKDILIDYKAYSQGKLHVSFVNPFQGGEQEKSRIYEELTEKGLVPTNLSVKTSEGLTQSVIFPGALISYQGRELAVNFFQNKMGASPEDVLNNSIQNIEYTLTSAFHKIETDTPSLIGFTEGHGELTDSEIADAMNTLSGRYRTGRVDLTSITQQMLNKLSILVIPKPEKEFAELEKYKIDQYVMQGGVLIWSVDNVSASLDSLKGQREQLSFAKKLNIDDMLFRYGARINYNLIADLNCAQIPMSVGKIANQAQIQLVPWLFYPLLMPISDNPIVKNLDAIRTEFISSIDTIAVKGIRSSVLLSSSPYSRVASVPGMISLSMAGQEPDMKTFKSNPLPVAVLLSGTFPSVFQNRPIPNGIKEQGRPLEKSKPTKMLVIADGDIFKNQISGKDGSVFPLGFDRYTGQQFGNKVFLQNVVDGLLNDTRLIELRTKELKLRLLDKQKIQNGKIVWQIANILVPQIFLIILALSFYYSRKRKFAQVYTS